MTSIVPHSRNSERVVLSYMLSNPERYLSKANAERLTRDHFHLPCHATLFDEIKSRTVEELELVILTQDLQRSGILAKIGGPAELAEIHNYLTIYISRWEPNVRELRESLARRRLYIDSLANAEAATSAEPDEIRRMLALTTERASDALRGRSKLTTAREASKELSERMAAIAAGDASAAGWMTGIAPLDLVTGGARAGQLWVAAAPTSGGKSVLLIQTSQEVSAAGGRVLILSLEMATWEVMARLTACRGGINVGLLTSMESASKSNLLKAKRTLEELSSEKLAIDDTPALTLDDIEGKVEDFAEVYGGIDLLVVDYIGLVESPRKNRNDTREMEVAAVSRGLKALAKKLGCAVLTASQLNDSGKLRDSRAIGFDADVVLCIENEGIRAMKVRNGRRGDLFPLVLDGPKQRFVQQCRT